MEFFARSAGCIANREVDPDRKICVRRATCRAALRPNNCGLLFATSPESICKSKRAWWGDRAARHGGTRPTDDVQARGDFLCRDAKRRGRFATGARTPRIRCSWLRSRVRSTTQTPLWALIHLFVLILMHHQIGSIVSLPGPRYEAVRVYPARRGYSRRHLLRSRLAITRITCLDTGSSLPSRLPGRGA